MKVIPRILTSSALLLVSGFCVYGDQATFEPGDFLPWRIGYACVGLLSLIGAAILWVPGERSPRLMHKESTPGSCGPP